jgi:hypothetical protein
MSLGPMSEPPDDALAARARGRLSLATEDIGVFAKLYVEDVTALLKERDALRAVVDGQTHAVDAQALRTAAAHEDIEAMAYGFLSRIMRRVADRIDPQP